MKRATLLVLAVALSAARPAAAQEPAACTYDACALRVEDNRIVRGARGAQVARWGLFQTPELTSLVQGSAQAEEHARIFDRTAPRAQWVSLAGALLLVAPRLNDDRHTSDVELGAVISGAALTLYGATLQVRAQRALSRAVWWYNRDLPPAPPSAQGSAPSAVPAPRH